MMSESFAARTEGLIARHGAELLRLAAASIDHGLSHGRPLPVSADDCAAELREPGASFVTLHRHGRLRGCIGTAEASQPLAVDVAGNGFAAAFLDGRFPPLSAFERQGLGISVSLLSPPAPLAFGDENDLLAQLRPFEDGVILSVEGRRALFLPQVWQQLGEPRLFLRQLKRKAGVPDDYWCRDVDAWRFICRSVASELANVSELGCIYP